MSKLDLQRRFENNFFFENREATRSWYKKYKNRLRKLKKEERGEINMVAIVLILLVVIALAAIFKESITALLIDLFDKLQNEAMKI